LLKRNLLFPLRNVVLRDRPISLSAGDESFLLAPRGNVPSEVWAGHFSEKHELNFVLGALRPGMTFLDIGANVGLFSIPAARKVRHGDVFAFEPTDSVYKVLRQNIGLNKLTNLQSFQLAIGDRVGEAVLQINVSGKDGLNTIGKPTHPDSEIVDQQTVPITTVDTFVHQNSISHVDVMKIDVEGAELPVLRGAVNLLTKPDAPLILFESGCLTTAGFGYHPVESTWFLENRGYRLFLMNAQDGSISKVVRSLAYDANLIAVKPTHPCFALLGDAVR